MTSTNYLYTTLSMARRPTAYIKRVKRIDLFFTRVNIMHTRQFYYYYPSNHLKINLNLIVTRRHDALRSTLSVCR